MTGLIKPNSRRDERSLFICSAECVLALFTYGISFSVDMSCISVVVFNYLHLLSSSLYKPFSAPLMSPANAWPLMVRYCCLVRFFLLAFKVSINAAKPVFGLISVSFPRPQEPLHHIILRRVP